MKAYMGFDRNAGSGEGAVLIFAENSREAKRKGFSIIRSWLDTEWIGMSATLIKDLPDHLKALDTGEAKVIESPPFCPCCELWGHSLSEDGQRCENCWDDEI